MKTLLAISKNTLNSCNTYGDEPDKVDEDYKEDEDDCDYNDTDRGNWNFQYYIDT